MTSFFYQGYSKCVGISNRPIVTWQSTHYSLIKLIANAKVSKLNMKHLESNVTMDVAHCAMEGNRYNSILLTNILGVCYWTTCLQDGNFNLSHCHITRHGNHEFFTIGISMYPLAMNRTKISMNRC